MEIKIKVFAALFLLFVAVVVAEPKTSDPETLKDSADPQLPSEPEVVPVLDNEAAESETEERDPLTVLNRAKRQWGYGGYGRPWGWRRPWFRRPWYGGYPYGGYPYGYGYGFPSIGFGLII